MKLKHISTKLLGGTVGAALLLGGASVAFAQTYANPDGTGALIPQNSIVPGSNPSTATGSTVGNPGTPVENGSANTTATGNTNASTGASANSGSDLSTPGIPNTGAGGEAVMSLAVLGASGLAAVAAAAYLARRRLGF